MKHNEQENPIDVVSKIQTDSGADLSDLPATSIQNYWHSRGYNGCIFSQIVAKKPEDFDWESRIIDHKNRDLAAEIDNLVNDAVSTPSVRLLSLVIPTIHTVNDLLSVLRVLNHETETIFLLKHEVHDQMVALSYRLAIQAGQERVLSWIMGFAPFSFLPKTRQSPYTEITIPVKVKPEGTYQKHNQDGSFAHVADQPLQLGQKVLDRIWDNTFKKTRKILGHNPDVFSGARTTFSISKEHWEGIK